MLWIIAGLAAPLSGFAVGARVELRAYVWAGALFAGLCLLGLALMIADNVRAEPAWRLGASPEEAAAQFAAVAGYLVGGVALGGWLSRLKSRAAAFAGVAAAACLYAAFGFGWSLIAGCLIFSNCVGAQ